MATEWQRQRNAPGACATALISTTRRRLEAGFGAASLSSVGPFLLVPDAAGLSAGAALEAGLASLLEEGFEAAALEAGLDGAAFDGGLEDVLDEAGV